MVDVLEERSTESTAAWFQEHPDIEVISRDRGKEYKQGATEGAPDATQVADRWHLLKNLRDNLKQWLDTKQTYLKAAAGAFEPDPTQSEAPASESSSEQTGEGVGNTEANQPSDTPEGATETPNTPDTLTKAQQQKVLRQAKRQQRYDAVKQLRQQGVSKSEIARRLNLNWRRVRKYLEAESCPVPTQRSPRGESILAAYHDYLQRRWQEGCHNATQLWREIRALGFEGSRRTVADWAIKKRPAHCSGDASQQVAPWSAHRASWLLVRPIEELSQQEQQALERMLQSNVQVSTAHNLAQCFRQMVTQRQSEMLDPWLTDATQSGIKALRNFAKSLRNALCLPWSQGQVEGQVNRLKMIKRSMYGRANVDLLRKKVMGCSLAV